MADGGEGTLDAVLSCGGQRLTDRISDVSGKPLAVAYGLIGEPATAVLEVAQVAVRLILPSPPSTSNIARPGRRRNDTQSLSMPAFAAS